MEDTFENLFKPEVRSAGRKLFAQEKVSISSGSDTSIQAYVRVAPPFKVVLTAEEIDSPTFSADCACPVAKKSRYCKHIWATLLQVEEKYPDFLLGKVDIQPMGSAQPSPAEEKKNTYQEAAKEKANDYRKAQYQKQKQHAKDKKNQGKSARPQFNAPVLSEEAEAALAYFAENGFPMSEGPSREILAEAKRKLSRVFHPDKGGSHDESVELNRNCDILLQLLP